MARVTDYYSDGVYCISFESKNLPGRIMGRGDNEWWWEDGERENGDTIRYDYASNLYEEFDRMVRRYKKTGNEYFLSLEDGSMTKKMEMVLDQIRRIEPRDGRNPNELKWGVIVNVETGDLYPGTEAHSEIGERMLMVSCDITEDPDDTYTGDAEYAYWDYLDDSDEPLPGYEESEEEEEEAEEEEPEEEDGE